MNDISLSNLKKTFVDFVLFIKQIHTHGKQKKIGKCSKVHENKAIYNLMTFKNPIVAGKKVGPERMVPSQGPRPWVSFQVWVLSF